jgi:hypothetical protein
MKRQTPRPAQDPNHHVPRYEAKCLEVVSSSSALADIDRKLAQLEKDRAVLLEDRLIIENDLRLRHAEAETLYGIAAGANLSHFVSPLAPLELPEIEVLEAAEAEAV